MSGITSKAKMITEENLTREQMECVNYAGDDLLVKGIAGSGKTIVLLQRAIKLQKKATRENKTIKVGFFTYANTLVKYADDLMKGLEGIDSNFLKVTTFHSYTGRLVYKYSTDKCQTLETSKQVKKEDFVSTAINNKISAQGEGHRLYELDKKFWIEEFSWIKGKYIKNKEDYTNSERTGRGSSIRMSKKDKEIAFELFEEYNKVLTDNRYIEYDDYSNILLNHFDKIKDNEKFDYVFVDEAQDLSYAQLLLLRKLATKGLVVAADHAQKIYKNTFTWREIGINVRGNASKSLKENFRSTKQIMELAYSLLSKNKSNIGRDTEYTKPEVPTTEGPLPELIICMSSIEEEQTFKTLLQNLKKQPNMVIGILYRTWKEKGFIERMLTIIGASHEEITRNKEWNLLSAGFKIVSLHSAKGLEFDIVVIPKLNQGVIPVIPQNKDVDEIEDYLEVERSLLYVGMTRAKNSLYMLSSGEISQFIDEFDEDLYKTTWI